MSKYRTISQTKRRHWRVRAKVSGDAVRPRLSVFRSSQHIWAQLIDDERGHTLAAVGTKAMKADKKILAANAAGKALAEKAKKLGVKGVVFDRGGRRYHGRVRAFADGARAGGLEF